MPKKRRIILAVLLVIVAGAIGGTIIFLKLQSAAEISIEATPAPAANVNLSAAQVNTIENECFVVSKVI